MTSTTTPNDTNTTTMGLVAASKFSSPPTIADSQRHETWMKKVTESSLLSDEVKKQEEEEEALDASTIPLRLQTFTNIYSLRPTPLEKELQLEATNLPRSGMIGGPDEANFLCMLLEMMKAKIVVEIGVFRGVTTLAFANCLKKMNNPTTDDSKVYALDISSDYAEIGKQYWSKAGVDNLIDLRIGDAKESMSKLVSELGENTVDMCFIDADKSSYDDYYEKSVQLTKPGGLIVVDNTLWGGMVALPDPVLESLTKNANQYTPDDASDDAMLVRRCIDTIAIKRLAVKIHNDERIDRVSFLTIADGVTICRKK